MPNRSRIKNVKPFKKKLSSKPRKRVAAIAAKKKVIVRHPGDPVPKIKKYRKKPYGIRILP